MEIEERWFNVPIQYRDRVYGLFAEMPFGEPMVIDQKVSPENREAFKVTVAYFIKWDEGRHNGYCIEFDNSFQKIRKIKL